MLAVPALGAIAVYLPALSGGFLSDDYSLLQMFYGVDANEVAVVWADAGLVLIRDRYGEIPRC